MYIFIWGVIAIFSLLDNKFNKRYFELMFFILTILLAFRFGQGTDYFNYYYNYVIEYSEHGEIGYRVITFLFHRLGISFEFFIFLVSIIQMIGLYRFIIYFDTYKYLGLLIAYHTVYLTYFMSAIRQGLVISIFLGFLIFKLIDNKKIIYVIGCIALSTIHISALILIPLVFLNKVKIKHLYIITTVAVFSALFFSLLSAYLPYIKIGVLVYDFTNVSFSIIGIIERITIFGFISYIYKKCTYSLKNELHFFLYRIYCYGFVISMFLLPWSLLSSRMVCMIKATEIVLIPILLKIQRKKIFYYIIIIYTLIMTSKNINTYINQQNYINVNIFNYPYVSIFQKEYFEKDERYKEIMNVEGYK